MRHNSIKITFDIYGHLWKDAGSNRQAMERLETTLLRKSNTDATRRPKTRGKPRVTSVRKSSYRGSIPLPASKT